MAEYTETYMHRRGVMLEALGQLLQNPRTTLNDLAAFEFEYGVDLTVMFRAKQAPEGSDDE